MKAKTFKLRDIVFPRWFIPGSPLGLCPDTRCVITEIVRFPKNANRACIVRDDGRPGSWWVDFDALRRQGEE